MGKKIIKIMLRITNWMIEHWSNPRENEWRIFRDSN